MKKKLFFIATTLYSNAQAVRCSIKSAWYAIIAFFISCLMLLTPVSISKYTTNGESIIKNFPHSTIMLYELIDELDSKGITCTVKNKKFSCDKLLEKKEYVYTDEINKKVITYTIVLLDETYDYKTVNENEVQENDNLIYFGKEKFYIRETSRDKDGKIESTVTLNGLYNHCNGFSFQKVTDQMDIVMNQYQGEVLEEQLLSMVENAGKSKTYEIFSEFLYHISISDFNSILFVWLLLAIVSCLLCIVSGAFILNYGNKKGNLSDEYGFIGSLKIACNLLLLPAILSVLIGLIMPESVIITAPIIFYIRLFFIYRAQFTRKGQKIAIKTHKGLEDMID